MLPITADQQETIGLYNVKLLILSASFSLSTAASLMSPARTLHSAILYTNIAFSYYLVYDVSFD